MRSLGLMEQLHSMIKDQDLDALIAEKVMGLKPITFRVPMASSTDIPRTEWIKEDEPLGIFGSSTSRDLPPYSTNIAAAWEVVEKLAPAEDEFRLTRFKQQKWRCTFSYFEGKEEEAETAPRAICLAALRSFA